MNGKQRREVAWVEAVRQASGLVPPGILVPGDRPDVRLVNAHSNIGIEVSELIPTVKHGPAHRAVDNFRREVGRRAATLYGRHVEAPPVDVLVYFGDELLRGVDDAARRLVDYVGSHLPPDGRCETFSEGAYEAFSVVRILRLPAGAPSKWTVLGSGEGVVLTEEHLREAISKKDRLVEGYRQNVPEVWLLLVIPAYAILPEEFVVTSAARDWAFEFSFDRVLVFSPLNGTFDLQRIATSVAV